MTARQLQRFLAFIPELGAREALDLAAVAAFPHLRGDAQEAMLRQWREAARIPRFAGYRRVPAEQARAWIEAWGRA